MKALREKVARIEDPDAFDFIVGEAGSVSQAKYWKGRQDQSRKKADEAIRAVLDDFESNLSPILLVYIQQYREGLGL